MNKKFKKQNGITLLSLVITVLVLLIISDTVIYGVKNNLGIEKLKDMQNDIENLSDKISIYYNKYGTLPVIETKYTNIDNIKNSGIISEKVDKGDFYIIDLSSIENLTLTYGKDYKKIGNSEIDINTLQDIYIINDVSHNIFYVKGVKLDDSIFYTNYTKDQVDNKEVNLRYIDNIKIPDGYLYVKGRKSDEIIIRDANDENKTYKWIVQEEKITEIPSGINININDTENFINSVNVYKGYYKNEQDNSIVVYIPLTQMWSETYSKQSIYEDKNGDIAVIPNGFQVSQTQGENQIKEGLVIRNSDTDDRYVWVKVPQTIYETAESENDYENIEKDMQNYTKDYRSSYTDNWYSGCGISTEIEYNNLKNKMLENVYKNGGFWISQYEIGSDSYTSSKNTSRSPMSKEGLYPYNYITCSEAQSLATNMNSKDWTSSLLFGIQWDLTLKFIEENGGRTKTQINTNSENLGNYQGVEFVIYKGKYSSDNGNNYTSVNKSYTKNKYDKILMTTGATKRNSALNIYDLEGNLLEYTLEQTSEATTGKLSAVRGGYYGNSGYASTHLYNDGNDEYNSFCGFRTTMF